MFKRKREGIVEFENGGAFGRAIFPKYGLWAKTMCKLGLHRSDGWPKHLACCRDCDMWHANKTYIGFLFGENRVWMGQTIQQRFIKQT